MGYLRFSKPIFKGTKCHKHKFYVIQQVLKLVMWPFDINFFAFCIVAIFKKWAAQYSFSGFPQPQQNLYL